MEYIIGNTPAVPPKRMSCDSQLNKNINARIFQNSRLKNPKIEFNARNSLWAIFILPKFILLTQQDYKKSAINSPYDFSLAHFLAKVYKEKFKEIDL